MTWAAIVILSLVVATLVAAVSDLRKRVRYLMKDENERRWEARGFRPPGV